MSIVLCDHRLFRFLKRTIALFMLVCLFFPCDSANADADEDRIYFFNTYNKICSSDMILIVSGKHCGLIDSSSRENPFISDKNNLIYNASEQDQLSNSEQYKNGKTIAEYMVDALGITHLDFIIGTHAHSDHIGGIPEIAQLVHRGIKLVDHNTAYICKPYVSINEKNDIAWLNPVFAYQAVSSMQQAGAAIIDVSKPWSAANSLNLVEGISQAIYYPGSGYDDYIQFQMGKYCIQLFNLFSTDTSIDENVNSIVTVVRKGNLSFVSLGDINVDQQVEQKVVRAIHKSIEKADLLKVAHHGHPKYSNTIESADCLQPTYAIRTSRGGSSGAYAIFQYYCRVNFGTKFYNVADVPIGICAFFGDKEITITGIGGDNQHVYSFDVPVDKTSPPDGWAASQILHASEDNDDTTLWMYFIKGSAKTGWLQIAHRTYYFDEDGIMVTGLQTIDGKIYCFSTTDCLYLHGEMITGWHQFEGKTYYFSPAGDALIGSQIIDGKLYTFGEDGVLIGS